MATSVIRGNNLYTYTIETDWTTSEAYCVDLGGHLVTINDQAENLFLVTRFGSNKWIGWTKGYQWSSGEVTSYENWYQGHPDERRLVDYARIGEGGRWFTASNDGGSGAGGHAKGIAEIPLSFAITRQGEVKEGAGVFTTSINLNAGNQTSGNLAKGAQVWWKVTGISSDDLDSGALSGTGTIQKGKLDIQHSLKVDTDSGESFGISVYSDNEFTQQIGATNSIVVDEEVDDEYTGKPPSGQNEGSVPLIRANSLYTLTTTERDWRSAENNAINLGGHLVNIDSIGENDFIVDFFSGLITDSNYFSHYEAGNLSTAYIGLFHKANTHITSAEWSNGVDAGYRNPGDGWWVESTYNAYYQIILDSTNSYTFNGRNGADASIGKWIMYNYRGEAPYNYTWGYNNYFSQTKGIAEIPLQLSINRQREVKEGSGVFTTSINLSAGTQTTGNLAEGAKVWWKVTGITVDDLVSGELFGEGIITNGKLDIEHSLKVDADSGETFEVSVYSDLWRMQQIGTTTIAAVLEAPVVRGNSLYTIVDGPSWTEAEANSVKLGGHLVTVGSAGENSFVTNSFAGISPGSIDGLALYIGYTDRVSARTWQWVSGSTSTYQNWAVGEPNSGGNPISGTGEDFAVIYPSSNKYGITGVWNDLDEIPSLVSQGISETPFIRRGDSAYVIVQGPTWEEAEANAVKLGGHLVTINDAAENDWIRSSFFSPTGEWDSSKWIGASDATQEGKWYWSSSDTSSYANWALGEPTNTQHSIIGEDYAAFHPNGLWFDIPNSPIEASSLAWFANGLTGIAEIKLAPNNTPIGTPTLSGTIKAGQVITIDKTSIQDADNFTGYTPDFKYSWEIANHPGMTMMMPNWESLKTADATDGNETFTITADLIGKLIRGVVSYLDGYGTNESLASTGSSPIQPGINLDIGSTSTTVSKSTRLAATISRMILTGIGNINATGNTLNNHLTGNNGNNILDGGVGNDILAGGRGNDTYIVDSIYDSIVENINEGIEIIQSSVNWTLGANLENLTLIGSGNLSGTGNELNNTIIGNSGNNVLDGGSGVDILDGGSGNDTLIGGLGNDVMKGGSGNDTYYVNSTGDSIVDTIGIDTVSSSISWTLGSNLENLTLTGTDALTGIGNSLKNTIIGNAGNNVLDGFGDKDILTGGAGADTFRFSTRPSFGALTADHIFDFKGSEGDLLQISKSAFGLASNATASLTTVSSASALTTALGSTSAFVYDSSNGNLYWNQNGNRSGFGTGGIFAVLDNKSALTSSNISLF